jgi:hypothetical protein
MTLDIKDATSVLAAHVAERTQGAAGTPGAPTYTGGPASKHMAQAHEIQAS